LIVAVTALGAGCSAEQRVKREGPNPYATEVPGEIDVMTAIAASEQTLRSWGYSIELDLATETRGRVVGRESERRAYGLLRGDSVEIKAFRGRRTTHLQVEQSNTDENEARALLRDVRTRLGLPN
jgi:hypothetical protein